MKVDLKVVEGALAYCEAHCDSGEESALVEWVVDKLADAIAVEHPRFNRGRFEGASLPIKHRALREAILARFGGTA